MAVLSVKKLVGRQCCHARNFGVIGFVLHPMVGTHRLAHNAMLRFGSADLDSALMGS